MIKKAGLVTLAISLLLVLLSPGLVQAQGGLTVLDSSVEAEFPFTLTFNLSAESDAEISDIRLHYTVDRDSFAQVTSEVFLEFEPATSVEVQWVWDMRRTGGLPPGTDLEYWWTIKDATGDRLQTEPLPLSFDDDRYAWRGLTGGEITIYWYRGDLSFARQVMTAAQQALSRLAESTGGYLKRPVRIFLYGSAQDLQSSMIFPQEWTGGVAFTNYGIIAIGIAPSNISWGEKAIAHELTHLVVHQMTFNPYTRLPTWLNEGLAMYAEGIIDPDLEGENLISVRSLSSPFSTDAAEANLSYVQSYSLVEFLISGYGQEKMLELLNTFSRGSSYDGALETVYGFDMDGLDTLWRDYISGRSREAGTPTTTVLTGVGR